MAKKENISFDKNKWGERLKELRHNAKLSGRELAQQANIKYPTYMAYETQNRQPSPENLIKIAGALGISVDYLLGNSPSLHEIPLKEVSKQEVENILYALSRHYVTSNIMKDWFQKKILANHDIGLDVRWLKAKLLNNDATFFNKPIDAQTRKAFFIRFNQMITELLYQDYFDDNDDDYDD